MSISVFSPVYSNFQHINEKCKVLRNAGSIFNWGQKTYEIKPFISGPGLELIEIKGSKPSFIGAILRIIGYITVIIPLMMLIGALIYRTVNKFQISTNQDIFQENDIGKSIVSRLSRKDLLTMRLTSQNNKWLAESVLIDHLISRRITPGNFGVNTVKDLITYFGIRCCEISTLDLKEFLNVSDFDMEMLGQSFPKARKLFLNHAQITNESINSILKMPLLEKLYLSNCEQISDISSLQQLQGLKKIVLLQCNNIADFNFLQNLQSLTSLYLYVPNHINNINFLESLELEKLGLSGNQNISDFRPLLKLKSLQSLDLLDCNHLNDLSVLQNLHELKQLTIFEGKKISNFDFLQHLRSLTSLSIWLSRIKDISFLQELIGLEELNFQICNHIEDISCVQNLKELKRLSLTGCSNITNLRPLQQLHNLQSLNITLCDHIQDTSCLDGLQGLKITR